jgi:hypothetical protein
MAVVRTFADHIEAMKPARTLDYWRMSVGDLGAKEIAVALVNTHITGLNLEDTNVGDDGACALAAFLEKSTTFKEMMLGAKGSGPAAPGRSSPLWRSARRCGRCG